MSEFIELLKPARTGEGWYVGSKHPNTYGGFAGWLRHDGNITIIVENPDDFYYHGHLDAMNAIKNYYHLHNKTFPYEYMLDLSKTLFGDNSQTINPTILTGSQELEL